MLIEFADMTNIYYSQVLFKVRVRVSQSCLTLRTPWDRTVYRVLQARILKWVAFPFYRGSSQPRGQTQASHIAGSHLSHRGSPRILEWVAFPFSWGSSQPKNWTGASCIAGGFFTSWATREATIPILRQKLQFREFPWSTGPVSSRAGIQILDFRVTILPNVCGASHSGTRWVINWKLFNCLIDNVYLNNFSLFKSQTPIYLKRNLLSSPCQTGSVLGLLPLT